MFARLIRRGWLRRSIELELFDGVHFVDYNARGVYDRVSVDGDVIRKFCSYWCVPRFEFDLLRPSCRC